MKVCIQTLKEGDRIRTNGQHYTLVHRYTDEWSGNRWVAFQHNKPFLPLLRLPDSLNCYLEKIEEEPCTDTE
jgi:hypothetical protein